jgi:hypothetical protein
MMLRVSLFRCLKITIPSIGFMLICELSGGRKGYNVGFQGWQSFTGVQENSKFSPPPQDAVQICANP